MSLGQNFFTILLLGRQESVQFLTETVTGTYVTVPVRQGVIRAERTKFSIGVTIKETNKVAPC